MYTRDMAYKKIIEVLINAKLNRNDIIGIAEELKNTVMIEIISDEVESRVKK